MPLGKTRLRNGRSVASLLTLAVSCSGVTDMSQGCEETQEWGLKNEAPVRAYSAKSAKKKRVHRRKGGFYQKYPWALNYTSATWTFVMSKTGWVLTSGPEIIPARPQ